MPRFVYADSGTNFGPSNIQYDRKNIITLPAFHWISVLDDATNPRHGHTCHASRGNRITTIGAADSNPPVYNSSADNAYNRAFTRKDSHAQGLGPLDMTQLKWMDGFRAESSPYTQSDVVQPFYGHAKRSVYTLTFLPSFDDCSVG